MSHKDLCPCSSGVLYSSCCRPLIVGDEPAVTAEEVMRSRYTAYFLKNEQYLLKTWHPSTRPLRIGSDAMSGWCGLNIVRTEAGSSKDNHGVVEFRATAVRGREIQQLHEVSRFVKERGQWLYLDGDIVKSAPAAAIDKVGRNDPCPCGSGKKFKRCCCV